MPNNSLLFETLINNIVRKVFLKSARSCLDLFKKNEVFVDTFREKLFIIIQ